MSENRQRLFFALWPDDATIQAIKINTKPYIVPLRGKILRPDQYHVTLAFLGSVGTCVQACVESVAESLHGSAFTLRLNNLGYFPRARVVWLGTDTAPSELSQLYLELNQKLQQNCHFEPDSRSFQPHLTLMRKVNQAEFKDPVLDIEWIVREFVLVRSETLPEGARYTVLRRWALLS